MKKDKEDEKFCKLIELINDCGDEFLQLQKYIEKWIACGIRNQYSKNEKFIMTYGDNPIQAVERLLVELNK